MKKTLAVFLALIMVLMSMPAVVAAAQKPKGAYESITFTKSQTVGYQFKTFNQFVVKSGVTVTLKKESGFEIAGDLIVEPGGKLICNGSPKGEFTFTTAAETTITGLDLYYKLENNGKVTMRKMPCTFQYARQNIDFFKEFEAKFKWDTSVNGWVLTTTLNGNPFNEPDLFYHQDQAQEAALKAAGKLNALGLFAGTGTNADGSINYSLWRTATRPEAIVMLVKLLGCNDEVMAKDALVKAGQAQWNCPFEDVKAKAAWAVPYVTYAYEKGWTSGTSATTFGLGTVSFQQYCCFLLKALGYTDADFPGSTIWSSCLAECENLGIDNAGPPHMLCKLDAYFWRADMVLMSVNALDCYMKHVETSTMTEGEDGTAGEAAGDPVPSGGPQRLMELLVSKGCFTVEQWNAASK